MPVLPPIPLTSQWHSRLWQDVMRGLSTRQYGPVVRRFADAYGIEKSVVSEQFIEFHFAEHRAQGGLSKLRCLVHVIRNRYHRFVRIDHA